MSDKSDSDEVTIGELMGERRLLPGEGEAMFAVEEIATANTVLYGARVMIEDRLGAEAARSIGDILRWAQSIILTAMFDADATDAGILSAAAEMFRKRLGDDDDDLLDNLPFGATLQA